MASKSSATAKITPSTTSLVRKLTPASDNTASLDADFLLNLSKELRDRFTVDTKLDDNAFFSAIGKLLMTKRGRGILNCSTQRTISPRHMVQLVCHCNPRLLSTFPQPFMPSLLSGMINSGISSTLSSSSSSSTTSSSSLTSIASLQSSLLLSSADAYIVGQSLSLTLASETTADSGVDLWLAQNVSLRSLAEASPQFKVLAVAIARRQLMQAPWGMAFRVSLGAGISLVDMITDLVTIERFFREGRRGFAVASVCMVGLCLLLQFLLVYVQYKKRGRSRILQESLYVLTLLKPAIDAHRVCSGEEAHPDNTVDTFTEMIFFKAVEM
jgi:hypothetical protein